MEKWRSTGNRRWAVVALSALLALTVAAPSGSAGATQGDQHAVAAKKKKKKKRDIPIGTWSGVTAQGTPLSFTTFKNRGPDDCEALSLGNTRCVGGFTVTMQATCGGVQRTFAATLLYSTPVEGKTTGPFVFRAIPFPDGWYELNVFGTLTRAGTATGTIRVFGDDPQHQPGGPCESGFVSWSAQLA